jgi:hypothetical protein
MSRRHLVINLLACGKSGTLVSAGHLARAGLARCSTSVNATLMGIAYMSLFVSKIVIGWIGGFYERMSAAAFWALHAAIAATGGLAVALFGRRLSCVLESA